MSCCFIDQEEEDQASGTRDPELWKKKNSCFWEKNMVEYIYVYMGNRPQIYGIYPIYGCVDLKIYEEDIRCVTLWCNACFREVWGYIMDLENNQKVIRSHPIHQTQYTRRLWYVMMWDWGWGLISPNQSRENLARIQRLFRFGGHIGEPGLVGLQNLSAQNWSLLIFTLWSLVN